MARVSPDYCLRLPKSSHFEMKTFYYFLIVFSMRSHYINSLYSNKMFNTTNISSNKHFNTCRSTWFGTGIRGQSSQEVHIRLSLVHSRTHSIRHAAYIGRHIEPLC